MTTIDQQVDEALQAFGVTFNAALAGETKRDDWQCDEWRIKLGTFETSFYTGIGHRKSKYTKPRFHNPRSIDSVKWDKQHLRPVAPSAASVVYSLLSDSQAADQCFADWCAVFGYSDDSIKAFETYNQCCKIGQAMRKVFTSAQRATLSDLLADY